jgi:hypothetical protein
MARVATAQADVAQNAILGSSTNYYLSLHTADPATSGTGEGTDGRRLVTFAASSAGTQASSNAPSWSAAAGGQNYSWFGVWTAATGGAYLRGGALTATISPGAGATISFAVAAIQLTAS